MRPKKPAHTDKSQAKASGLSGAPRKRRARKPAIRLTLYIHPRLRERIREAATALDMPMNEWIARLAAEHLGCPDLAPVPRRPRGGRFRFDPEDYEVSSESEPLE